MATAKEYGRHRHDFQEEIIYPQMMAEITGEAADNYRGRPFDADLFDYAPSALKGATADDWAAGTAKALGVPWPPAKLLPPDPPAKTQPWQPDRRSEW